MVRYIQRYMRLILYGFFGVLTTVVNILTYGLGTRMMHLPVMMSTIIAWLLAVLFAYVTNRRWVFHSHRRGVAGILSEMVAFFACRLGTGVIDFIGMFVLVSIMGFDGIWVKGVLDVGIIILNFVASKFLVFRHR